MANAILPPPTNPIRSSSLAIFTAFCSADNDDDGSAREITLLHSDMLCYVCGLVIYMMNVCRSIVREENRFSQSRCSTQTVAYQNKILFQPNDDHATIELTHLNQLINMVRAKKKKQILFFFEH